MAEVGVVEVGVAVEAEDADGSSGSGVRHVDCRVRHGHVANKLQVFAQHLQVTECTHRAL